MEGKISLILSGVVPARSAMHGFLAEVRLRLLVRKSSFAFDVYAAVKNDNKSEIYDAFPKRFESSSA